MQLSFVPNVLMIGPPGAGKTLLARAIAHLAFALQYHPRMAYRL